MGAVRSLTGLVHKHAWCWQAYERAESADQEGLCHQSDMAAAAYWGLQPAKQSVNLEQGLARWHDWMPFCDMPKPDYR